jgi:secondary thiamine-phosphate synthase enzyme
MSRGSDVHSPALRHTQKRHSAKCMNRLPTRSAANRCLSVRDRRSEVLACRLLEPYNGRGWLCATAIGRRAMVYQEEFSFETRGHRHMVDVTSRVAGIIDRSGVKTGVAQLFCVGSTAALGTIEFEPGLERDLPEMLDRLIPPSRDYGHEQMWHDGNGHSHLQATLMGPSLAVPVAKGKAVLGTWQQIIHLECDVRPRDRTVVVTVLGETADNRD